MYSGYHWFHAGNQAAVQVACHSQGEREYRARWLDFNQMIPNTTKDQSLPSAYGVAAKVKISHAATPNCHTSDLCVGGLFRRLSMACHREKGSLSAPWNSGIVLKNLYRYSYVDNTLNLPLDALACPRPMADNLQTPSENRTVYLQSHWFIVN